MRVRILFNSLFPPLTELEKKLLAIVSQQLSSEARLLFDAQASRVNYVQRLTGGKEVNLYSIKHGKPSVKDSTLFPLRLPEARLAIVEFSAQHGSKLFTVAFWLTAGRLFSMEYNQSPTRIASTEIEIKQVKILVDPMVAETIGRTELPEESQLAGWLIDWAKFGKPSNLRKPLPSAERQKIIEQLGVKLPQEYLGIVAQTEGLKIQDCAILGLSEIRSVAFPHANYYVLAEFDGRGALGVDQGGAEEQIWFFDYEEKPPEAMGFSFRAAIEKKLAKSVDRM